MSSGRALVVRGIPASWTADDIQQVFANDTHCLGGLVEKVELAAGEGTATVTFKDACGNL